MRLRCGRASGRARRNVVRVLLLRRGLQCEVDTGYVRCAHREKRDRPSPRDLGGCSGPIVCRARGISWAIGATVFGALSTVFDAFLRLCEVFELRKPRGPQAPPFLH